MKLKEEIIQMLKQELNKLKTSYTNLELQIRKFLYDIGKPVQRKTIWQRLKLKRTTTFEHLFKLELKDEVFRFPEWNKKKKRGRTPIYWELTEIGKLRELEKRRFEEHGKNKS